MTDHTDPLQEDDDDFSTVASDFENFDYSTPATETEPTESKPAKKAPKKLELPTDMGIPEIIRWDQADYGQIIKTGAGKLASSAVAPLVAAARGYTTLIEENLKDFVTENKIKRRSKQYARLEEQVLAYDVLTMPWFNLPHVADAHVHGHTIKNIGMQFRPAVPAQNEKGKELKYEFIAGTETPIDVHPATPASWLVSDEIPVMVAEGLLKGDAALSAMLIDAGVSREQLMVPTGGLDEARADLMALMEAVPESKRVLIMSVAGVYNWRQHPSWTATSFKDRRVLIAFDGDTSTNPDVWKQAKTLESYLSDSREAKVEFISPTATSGDGGEIAKMGVDDYLAEIGTWSSLLAQTTTDLGERPDNKDPYKVGDWVVTEDGCSVVEYVEKTDALGNKAGVKPQVRAEIGGRIMSLSDHRHPTAEEMAKGKLGSGVDREEVETIVAIELQWRENDAVHAAIITGPDTMLATQPENWSKRGTEIKIPPEVLALPAWPPRKGRLGGNGDWLSAVKQNRRAEITRHTVWKSMGWVPFDGGMPVFSLGAGQVVGASEDSITSAVSESTLSGSTRFQFLDDQREFDDPCYRQELADDIRTMITEFADNGVFTQPGKGMAIVAAALRPILPIRAKSTLYFVGPPGTGKTWCAQLLMAFWTADSDRWWDAGLPGSATDTAYSTETAISRSPLWVVDDFAPSVDRRSSDKQSQAIEEIIRSVFNGTSKRRMNADGSSREVARPRALLVATAEIEPVTGSIRERTLMIPVPKGSLHTETEVTDHITEFAKSGALARVSAGMVKYLRWRAERTPDEWEGMIGELQADIASLAATAEAELKASYNVGRSAITRASKVAADLTIACNVLGELAAELGFDMPETFRLQDHKRAGSFPREIVRLVAQTNERNADLSIGRNVLSTLASMLSSGQVHLSGVDDPMVPPIVGADSVHMNLACGWVPGHDSDMRPAGNNIGHIVERNGTRYALLNLDTPISEIHRLRAGTLSYGLTPTNVWTAMWDEKLAGGVQYDENGEPKTEIDPKTNKVKLVTDWGREKRTSKTGGGTELHYSQYRTGARGSKNTLNIRAVPVELDLLFRGGGPVGELDVTEPTRHTPDD